MLAEYLFKYRMLKPWARFLIVCVLGVLPGAWRYLDSAPDLETQLESATGLENTARQKLARAKADLKELPALESKRSATTLLLSKAETKLPNDVFVDEVLQMVSQRANESDVTIRKFEPLNRKLIQGDYPYSEARFKIGMEGKYGRLGDWLDNVAGAQSIAAVKSWTIQRSTAFKKIGSTRNRPKIVIKQEAIDDGSNGVPKEVAEKARQDLLLGMDLELVLYSSASPQQLAAAEALAQAEKAAADKRDGRTPETKPANANPKTGGGA